MKNHCVSHFHLVLKSVFTGSKEFFLSPFPSHGACAPCCPGLQIVHDAYPCFCSSCGDFSGEAALSMAEMQCGRACAYKSPQCFSHAYYVFFTFFSSQILIAMYKFNARERPSERHTNEIESTPPTLPIRDNSGGVLTVEASGQVHSERAEIITSSKWMELNHYEVPSSWKGFSPKWGLPSL